MVLYYYEGMIYLHYTTGCVSKYWILYVWVRSINVADPEPGTGKYWILHTRPGALNWFGETM
jgi:hypothetical protein